MPSPNQRKLNKNKKHRTSTRFPTLCCRWSEKEARWIWGYRITLTEQGVNQQFHIHEFDTMEDAQEAVAAIRERLKIEKHGLRPIINRPRLDELITKRKKDLKGRTEYVRAARVLEYWLNLLPAGVLIDEVDSPHIQTFIDNRLDDGVGLSSIDREINIIVACLNSAKIHYKELRQWLLPPIPRPKFPKVTTRQIIPVEIYRKLVTYLFHERKGNEQKQAYEARLRVGRILRFMNLTGCRSAETFELKVEHIEWDFNRIHVIAGKTDDDRYVPISRQCAEILHDQLKRNQQARKTPKQKNSPYVFTLGGNPTPKIYRILRDACAFAEVEDITLYWSRHTFITTLLHEGHDLKTVGRIVGHSDETMTLYYAHVMPNALENVALSLDEIETARLDLVSEQIVNVKSK